MTIPAGYATDKELYAARYRQGNRTVFSAAMTPAQLASVVKRPDPSIKNSGNRRIRADHALAFARYFIENDNWVIPGVILRAPSIFKFAPDKEVPDMQFGTLSYPERNQGDIHILDGQHRILGFHMALDLVDDKMDKARSALATAKRVDPKGRAVADAQKEIERLEKVRGRLFSERVSVEIQVTDDLQAFRQMFFDIADNALGITASVKARFDSRKVVNRALPAILEHPLLENRVDLEADRIPRNSANWLTARHIAETTRVLTVGYDGRLSKRMDKELSEVEIARNGLEFFTMLGEVFPVLASLEVGQITAERIRDTSMLGSAAFVRVLAGVHYELITNHSWSKSAVKAFFEQLVPHTNAPAHANSIWRLHAAPEAFNEGAFGPNQRRQDAKGLVLTIADWAILGETFVTEAPKPAPEPEIDPDEGLDFAFDHDTKPLEVEVRNEAEDIAKAGRARARTVKKKAE